MTYYDQVKEAADAVRSRIPEVPQIGVVLGSGLGDFANSLSEAVTIPYGDLPHWPASHVIGHQGKLVVGKVAGRTIAALAGRSHVYEGHALRTATFAVRVLGVLGIRTLIITNAAGGVNTGFSQGALMVIDDHINLMGLNPLVGDNDDRFGVRFPDMTQVYSSRLREIADRAGKAMNLLLPHGVYVALLGPSYETPAEIRYLRTIGADAVGMSTVPEAIVARQMGMRTLGISLISNAAAGMAEGPIDHEVVMKTGERVSRQFAELLRRIIPRMGPSGG